MSDPFFEQRTDWSRHKHQILDKYLRVWVYKLSSRYGTLAFVDACAGPGRYSDGTEGSPLLAAKWNDEQVLVRKRGRLLILACEENPSNAKLLQQNLAPWIGRDPHCAEVIDSNFEVALPDLLRRTRALPTIFFIDPYGPTLLAADRLGPLLADRDRAPTEILARLDPVMLARFAGWLRRRERNPSSHKAANKFRESLRHYNIDVEALEATLKAGDAEYAPDRMMMFGQYLRLIRQRFHWVQIVPIRPTYHSAPKYYLFHGTDSPDGAAKLNDIVSTTEDSLFADSEANGPQTLLFEPERPPRIYPADAKRLVIRLLAGGPKMFVELCAELAVRLGPDLREKHHHAAVRALATEGRIVLTPPGAIVRTTTVALIGPAGSEAL